MATRENEMIVAGSQTPPRVTIHAMLPPGSSSEANPHRQPISGSSGYAPSTATTSSAYAPAAGATYGSGYGNDKESYGSSAYVPSSRAMGSDVGSSGYGNEKVYGSQVPSSHAGSGASALGGVHDKNAYGLGAAAGAPAGAVAGYSAAGPHPTGYDANRLSGIFLRPGIVFPSGDVPRHHPTAAIFDVGMVLLLFAGYIVITALAEWTTTSPGRKGLYFGSMWLVLIGLISWLAAFWFGWRYARESVTISTAARGLWIGMLIGAIVFAVEWGIVIETLQLQYDQWHLNGISFTSRQVTKLIILKALVLPIIGQTLILLYLYWRTSRRDNRLWRPYSYLILAICLEVGCWASQQVIVYSAYPAWHQSFAGGLSNSDVARGVFGEALFFLLCASPFFIVAGIIAGASRAIHQLHDKEQVEVAHVADLPSELFPGPVAASILWMMMIFLRGFPEVFRLLVLTNGGQGIGPTKTAITIVYILIGLFGYMLLRHRLRNTLPVIFHLDPMDYFGTRNSRAANVVVHRDAIHQQQTAVPVGAARV